MRLNQWSLGRISHLPKKSSYERKWHIWHTRYFWNWWRLYLISTVTLQTEIQKTGWDVVCVTWLWAGVKIATRTLSWHGNSESERHCCCMCDRVVSRHWECCKNTFPTWRSWVWVATSALTRSLQPSTGDHWLLTYLPVFNVTSNLKMKTKIIFFISDTIWMNEKLLCMS